MTKKEKKSLQENTMSLPCVTGAKTEQAFRAEKKFLGKLKGCKLNFWKVIIKPHGSIESY